MCVSTYIYVYVYVDTIVLRFLVVIIIRTVIVSISITNTSMNIYIIRDSEGQYCLPIHCSQGWEFGGSASGCKIYKPNQDMFAPGTTYFGEGIVNCFLRGPEAMHFTT